MKSWRNQSQVNGDKCPALLIQLATPAAASIPGNVSIEDAPRSGRPTVIGNDQVKQIIDQNPQFTTRQIEDIAKVLKATFARRLKEIGYISKLDVWVPHQLTDTQLNHRISTCDLFLKRQK